jgi:hypothetical protein
MVPELIVSTLLESDLQFSGVFNDYSLDWDVIGGLEDSALEDATVKINWSVEFDVREWGVKDIVFSVQSLEIFMRFAIHRDAATKPEEEVVFDEVTLQYPGATPPRPKDETDIAAMTEYYSKKPVEVSAEWQPGTTMHPTGIMVDLRTNRVEVKFG